MDKKLLNVLTILLVLDKYEKESFRIVDTG